MSKIIVIKYTRSGEELITDGLSDDEKKTVEEMFDDGIRDPGMMRAEIGM